MSARVLRGQVRQGHGRDCVVMRTERGRKGEARTVVVIGEHVGDGIVQARETVSYATVAEWALCGRGRVSTGAPGGAYYYAPRWGMPTPWRSAVEVAS